MLEFSSEQEQLDFIRSCWSRYGKYLLAFVLLTVAALSGWSFWKMRQARDAERASVLYQSFSSSVLAGDSLVKVGVQADVLLSTYPRSTYASLAALQVGKQQVENNDLPHAAQTFRWVVDHSHSVVIQDLADISLARVQVALGQADLALQSLGTSRNPLANVLRGDIESAAGHREKALDFYHQAQKSLPTSSPLYQLVNLRLNSESIGVALVGGVL